MIAAFIFYGIVILGGIALGAFSMSSSGRNKEPWMRKALLLAGIFGILWGIASIVVGYFPSVIPERAIVSATNLKSGFGGATVGLIIYLMLFKSFWREIPQKNER